MHKKLIIFLILFFISSVIFSEFKNNWEIIDAIVENDDAVNGIIDSKNFGFDDEKNSLISIHKTIRNINQLLGEKKYDEAMSDFKQVEPQLNFIISKYLVDIQNTSEQLKKCKQNMNCSERNVEDLFKKEQDFENKLGFVNDGVINHIYFKIGDIYFERKDFKNALDYYKKDESLAFYSKFASVIMRDRYKFSYVLALAMKSVDFNVEKYEKVFKDSFVYSFGVPLVSDLDGDGMNEIILSDPNNLGGNSNGIIVIKFLNKDYSEWKAYYKTIKSRYINITINNISNKNKIVIKYDNGYMEDYKNTSKFPNINVNKEGAIEFNNGFKVIKKFESTQEENIYLENRFNDNRDNFNIEFLN